MCLVKSAFIAIKKSLSCLINSSVHQSWGIHLEFWHFYVPLFRTQWKERYSMGSFLPASSLVSFSGFCPNVEQIPVAGAGMQLLKVGQSWSLPWAGLCLAWTPVNGSSLAGIPGVPGVPVPSRDTAGVSAGIPLLCRPQGGIPWVRDCGAADLDFCAVVPSQEIFLSLFIYGPCLPHWVFSPCWSHQSLGVHSSISFQGQLLSVKKYFFTFPLQG